MTPILNLTRTVAPECSRDINQALLRDLIADPTLPSPLLLLSKSHVAANYRALRAALPRADIRYAVKSNGHAAILDEIARCGGNFDVCSAGEIDDVLRTGVNPANQIHSHPIKSKAEFDRAVEKGIDIFVVDNPDEVEKLRRYTDRALKILIRYRIVTNNTAVVNLQYKFGCTVEDVLPLARKVRETGHKFHGLCFHIGSQCIYTDNYVKAIQAAAELISALDNEDFSTDLLDIGGGFPVEYVEPTPEIGEFCRPIEQALNRLIRPEINVVCEPGRFISASPTTLLCTVIGKAERDGKSWYYLDDGLYSTFSGILYDQCQYPVVSLGDEEEKLSVLAGPTCDSFDVMYDGLMLPKQKIGDRLIFPLTGAYCAVSGSNFNSLARPAIKVID